jgi:hypothetical protein
MRWQARRRCHAAMLHGDGRHGEGAMQPFCTAKAGTAKVPCSYAARRRRRCHAAMLHGEGRHGEGAMQLCCTATAGAAKVPCSYAARRRQARRRCHAAMLHGEGTAKVASSSACSSAGSSRTQNTLVPNIRARVLFKSCLLVLRPRLDFCNPFHGESKA